MPKIGVDKTIGNKAPPLIVGFNSWRIKYKIVDHFFI
jgi:hypothetical protein